MDVVVAILFIKLLDNEDDCVIVGDENKKIVEIGGY